jgi:hypothetical protein
VGGYLDEAGGFGKVERCIPNFGKEYGVYLVVELEVF